MYMFEKLYIVNSHALWASRVAQIIKNPPTVWKIWVRSLGWEEPLEKEWQPTPVIAW